jgi:hypothetical protein
MIFLEKYRCILRLRLDSQTASLPNGFEAAGFKTSAWAVQVFCLASFTGCFQVFCMNQFRRPYSRSFAQAWIVLDGSDR